MQQRRAAAAPGAANPRVVQTGAPALGPPPAAPLRPAAPRPITTMLRPPPPRKPLPVAPQPALPAPKPAPPAAKPAPPVPKPVPPAPKPLRVAPKPVPPAPQASPPAVTPAAAAAPKPGSPFSGSDGDGGVTEVPVVCNGLPGTFLVERQMMVGGWVGGNVGISACVYVGGRWVNGRGRGAGVVVLVGVWVCMHVGVGGEAVGLHACGCGWGGGKRGWHTRWAACPPSLRPAPALPPALLPPPTYTPHTPPALPQACYCPVCTSRAEKEGLRRIVVSPSEYERHAGKCLPSFIHRSDMSALPAVQPQETWQSRCALVAGAATCLLSRLRPLPAKPTLHAQALLSAWPAWLAPGALHLCCVAFLALPLPAFLIACAAQQPCFPVTVRTDCAPNCAPNVQAAAPARSGGGRCTRRTTRASPLGIG